jgi:hypothetical protein
VLVIAKTAKGIEVKLFFDFSSKKAGTNNPTFKQFLEIFLKIA